MSDLAAINNCSFEVTEMDIRAEDNCVVFLLPNKLVTLTAAPSTNPLAGPYPIMGSSDILLTPGTRTSFLAGPFLLNIPPITPIRSTGFTEPCSGRDDGRFWATT